MGLVEFKRIRIGARFKIADLTGCEPEVAGLEFEKTGAMLVPITVVDEVSYKEWHVEIIYNAINEHGRKIMVGGWRAVSLIDQADLLYPDRHCDQCWSYCPGGTTIDGLCIPCTDGILADEPGCAWCRSIFEPIGLPVPGGELVSGQVMGTEGPIEFTGYLCDRCKAELIGLK